MEKGSKKYICPACSQKRFVRYVTLKTNEHLDSDVGRCDRESKCGYHFTPKEFFAVNPQRPVNQPYKAITQKKVSNYASTDKNGTQAKYELQNTPKKPDFISNDVLLRTLTNYEQNVFVKFLTNLFQNRFDEVEKAVKDYRIGTTKDGKTIFWQIDQLQRIRTGKIIAYDGETGKRRKDIFPNWTHAVLKRARLLRPDFNLNQCFFGEHLLISKKDLPIMIVEAEKTAVIASICFPEFVCLAIGSKQNLKVEKLKRLGQRKIVLYPDADGFLLWQEIALKARSQSLDVRLSDLIEKHGTDAEKNNGFDLADYLINQQICRLHRQNEFASLYNAKLEKVLSDKKLLNDFEKILDEQKAVLIIDGNLSESNAEMHVTEFENMRQVVLSL